jgi:exopolysaccharide biosynthesis polyprenyl glycosylphosphotransferase
MHRHDPLAGRRILLISADASLAFALGFSLAQRASRQEKELAGACMALIAIASLKFLGNYLHTLRKSLGSHVGGLAVVSISSCFGLRFANMVRGISPPGTGVWRAAFLLFSALFAVRMLLIHAHRCWLVRKRLWVMGDTLLAAHQLAAKAQTFAKFYQVKHTSGPPSAQDLHRNLAGVDAVLCSPSLRARVQMACHTLGKELLLVPSVSDVLLYTACAHPLDDQVVLSLPRLQLTAVQRWLKRAFDIVGAGVLMLVCAPVMAALYWLIPRVSAGPAIFRQERRGLHGRSFEMLKFRTMIPDAENFSGPVLASVRDGRVTRLGRLLRSTRLDELPQLINVLRGEMSLIGPRPEREFFARRFDEDLPGYGLRSSVKPGLTGLAQVWGSYSTEVEDKLRLDLLYIANQSLRLDLELILHTVRVVFHRSQSAGIDRPAVRRFHLPVVNEPLGDAVAENPPFREAVRGRAQTKLQ